MADPFDSFEDIFNPLFRGEVPRQKEPRLPKQPEKGVPWEAKRIDGRYYVPLEQVAELLAMNGVLPAVRRGLEARVQQAKDLKKLQEEDNGG